MSCWHSSASGHHHRAYLGEDGKPIQYIAIRADITERALQETNVELESARLTAEKANLAKSVFLSSLRHKLRTPPNAIIGFSEVLADETLAT